MCFLLSLQLQAALTGAISQGLNTAMINVATTVEHDLGDALFQSLCCDLLTDLSCGLDVAAETIEVLVHSGCRHQGHALLIIDDLSVNVLGGAENIQTGTCCGAADLVTNAAMTTKTSFVLVDLLNHCLSLLTLFLALAGLAFFVLDNLACVADALALVRFRRLLGADLGGVLAHLLLVNTGNREVVGILPHDGAVLGIGDIHLVGEAQVHNKVGALLLAAQANAHDLQLLLVAVHNTVDHVSDVGTGQAVQAAGLGLVIDLAETMPFFAEKRLIVFENTGFFKTAAGAELADYIKEMPETTYFIFVEEEVDKRNKLYKAVNTKGYAAALTMQDEEVLKRWIGQILRREGKEMSGATISYFLGKVGTDMENIQRELEKVICYGIDKATLTREEIDAVCVTQLSNHIFDMVDAVAAGNQRKALDLYYELIALKEPPMRILYMLTRQYRSLYFVKALMNQGYGKKEIASKAGLHPFVVGKSMVQCKRFRMGQLRQSMEEGAGLEQAVKTGTLSENLAVELFIVKQSEKR